MNPPRREALLEELWASQPTTDGDAVEDLRQTRIAESADLLARSKSDEPAGIRDETTQEEIEEFFASLADS